MPDRTPAHSSASPPTPRTLDVRHISKDDAKAIVLPNHYSGTWNTAFGRVNFGVFDGEELCGAAVFGHLMNPASAASIANLPDGAIVELNRLWIDDRFGKNTETAMLSRCFKWLKANTTVELIQSFLSAMLRTNAWWVDGQLETFEVRTYRYLYPLTKRARKSINLWPEPYPPYSKGVIETPGYRMPLAQIARCYAVCEAKGDPRAQKFLDYLASEAAPEDLERLLDEAEENAWVAQVKAEAYAQPSLLDELGVA